MFIKIITRGLQISNEWKREFAIFSISNIDKHKSRLSNKCISGISLLIKRNIFWIIIFFALKSVIRLICTCLNAYSYGSGGNTPATRLIGIFNKSMILYGRRNQHVFYYDLVSPIIPDLTSLAGYVCYVFVHDVYLLPYILYIFIALLLRKNNIILVLTIFAQLCDCF